MTDFYCIKGISLLENVVSFFLSLKSVDTIYLNNYKEKGMPVLSLSYGAFNLTFLAPKLKVQHGSYFN